MSIFYTTRVLCSMLFVTDNEGGDSDVKSTHLFSMCVFVTVI